jgi:hypothetical protein
VALPKVPNRREWVVLGDGQKIEVRGLTRGEHAHMTKLVEAGDVTRAEVYALAHGTDSDAADAEEWYASTPSPDVEAVINAIGGLTRLSEGASKSHPASVPER